MLGCNCVLAERDSSSSAQVDIFLSYTASDVVAKPGGTAVKTAAPATLQCDTRLPRLNVAVS